MDETASKIKPGETLWCRVESPEPGGYTVSVVSRGIKGFLPSTHAIEVGKSVPTTFVCMNGEQALFTFAFTMGTSARVQHSTASDQENAFAVWVDAHPKSISLRRAVDLIMPPLDNSSLVLLKLNAEKASDFFSTLEEKKFTGCIKIYCQGRLSRSALILFHGRAVGSIYTQKPHPDPYPFRIGIKKLLEDLSSPDGEADAEMYELPEEIVLAMSSLFLGYVDQGQDQLDNMSYTSKMLSHFSASKEFACFNMLDSETDTTVALAFVGFGELMGTYTIAERIFSEELDFMQQLLAHQSSLKLQVHILPTALTTDAVQFGYTLRSDNFAL